MAGNAVLFAVDRSRVQSILTRAGWKVREKKLAVWNFFLARETEAGTIFLVTEPDHDLYIILGLTNETIQLPPYGRGGLPLFSYLNARYGISEKEDSTKFLYDTLRSHIWRTGEHAELRRFSAFNHITKCAYLSTYDGHLWKMDGTTIARCSNGEDGIFFADDDGGLPCPEIEIGPHGELLQFLTGLNFAALSPGGMTPIHQQRALMVWMLSTALPDLMPTKPLLIVEGAPGSGKSSAMQLLQLALLGKKRPTILSAKQEDDFGIILLRAPICVLDNLDGYVPWLPDAVCAYVTAGEWTRRRLYTDNEQITIRPHSFIAVASKNPVSFRREDTADRCIVLRLERRKKFQHQGKLEAKVLGQRARLLGEFIWLINQMVKTIRERTVDEEIEEVNRMADFAGMTRVVGKVLDWTTDDVENLLHSLQSERNAFINEGDSLGEILGKWIVYRPKNGPSNINREIPLNLLFAELETISEANSLQFYRTPQILSQKLRSPHLENDFVIESSNVDGHAAYRIRRRTDPQLASVPLSKKFTEE